MGKGVADCQKFPAIWAEKSHQMSNSMRLDAICVKFDGNRQTCFLRHTLTQHEEFHEWKLCRFPKWHSG